MFAAPAHSCSNALLALEAAKRGAAKPVSASCPEPRVSVATGSELYVKSGLNQMMNLVTRKRGTKGVRERQLEEPPLGNPAAACHREESASHHLAQRYRGSTGCLPYRQAEPPLASLAVTCHLEENASHHFSYCSISLQNISV